MKTKKLILGSFLALTGVTISQNTFPWPNTGYVGIGTNSPLEMLDVAIPLSSGGIQVKNNSTNSAYLRLKTSGTGAGDFMVGATGSSQIEGNGSFVIHDAVAHDTRFLIAPTGNIGIGVINPINAKLEIRQNANTQTMNRGFYSDATNTTWIAGTSGASYGVTIGAHGRGGSPCFPGATSKNYGVYGDAFGGIPYGGFFLGNSTCNPAYGVFGSASGTGSSFAGYFNGAVYGTSFGPSDRKLKNDIKPLSNAIDKLKLLKPSTYTYKTTEYKDMNLPVGQQMGLIAQELEEVFPELIREVREMNHKNDKGETILKIEGHKSVNYTNLIPLLIAGIQEQQKQLDEQKELIEQLSQKASNTTGINSINAVETGFQMSQNEPNPFTHETVVKYTLPQTISNAFMAVYDLTGKQITTFPITEKGSSSITITSEKLAAGIYIYSIVADGKVVDSKRMIVAEK